MESTMWADKHVTHNSPVPERELFSALVYVVQQGKYEIGGLRHELQDLLFKGDPTLISYGHFFVATVKADGPGSVLQLSVFGVPGAPKALLDGWKNKKAGAALVEAVEEVLTAANPPRPEPVQSFAVMQDGSTVPWTSGEFPGF